MHRDAHCAIFLGDGLGDAEEVAREFEMPLWAVRGNCDGFPALWEHVPTEQTVMLGGMRLFLTHGHRLGVKSGVGALVAQAKREGCEIALFGHTHTPCEMYLPDPSSPLYLFNPGSIGNPREGEPSYGLLTLEGGNILFSHGEVPY
jgi:hypothetical protein